MFSLSTVAFAIIIVCRRVLLVRVKSSCVLLFGVFRQYCVVVFADHVLHVIHAAVAKSYSVAVKDLVKFVCSRKVFVNKLQEFTSNVCFYVYAVRRVVPNGVAAPGSSL